MSNDLNDNRMFKPLKIPILKNDSAHSNQNTVSPSRPINKINSNNINNNFKNKDCLDLNQAIFNLTDLKHFEFQDNDIIPYIKNESYPTSTNTQKHILIVDISPNDPSSFDPVDFSKEKLTSNFIIDRIHLNLPTTLVRRPKFKFENLLQASLPKDKIQNLLNLIDLCSTYIIFDENSQFEKCSKKTYFLFNKFKQYIFSKYGTTKQLIFISSPNAPDCVSVTTTSSPLDSPIQKYNLSINIPPINSTPSRKKMFVQSIKKDTVHYSPLSLYKYFQFNVPNEIEANDSVLPNWLKQYSDKTKSNELLLKLENNFQLLEEFEMERLSTCLVNDSKKISSNNSLLVKGTNNDKQSKSSDSTPITSTHKIYSLTYLQKQFKQQRSLGNSPTTRTNPSNTIKSIEKSDNSYTPLPTESSFSNNNIDDLKEDSQFELGKKSSPSLFISTDQLSALDNNPSPYSGNTNSSSEALLTPLDNYEVSQGIQSFSKNRYSNILPYEHSRVKLHFSPLELPRLNKSDNGSKGFFISDDNNSINETTAINYDSTSIASSTPDKTSNAMKRKRQKSLTLISGDSSLMSDLSLENASEKNNITKSRPRLLRSSSSSYLRGQFQADKNKFNDYFNANYLNIPQINNDYKYVATQAPLVSTVDDFWNVVLANKIKVIVSLNSESELEMKKWDIYWNNKNNSKHPINILATFNDVNRLKGCILRIFQVFRKDKKSYSIIFQIQYTQWLDSCTIDIEELLQIFKLKDNLIVHPIIYVKSIIESESKGENEKTSMDARLQWRDLLSNSINFNEYLKSETPLLIHCSAGCGRTGVFIALDFLIKILNSSTNQANRIDVWNIPNDLIFIIINELRKQRLSMVQNLSQYITCYESLLKYFALIKIKKITI